MVLSKKRRNARIAKFPERPVENEVMDIDKRRKRQKARGKVGMKNAADDPGPGNKQRDASGNQRHKIARERPVEYRRPHALRFLW